MRIHAFTVVLWAVVLGGLPAGAEHLAAIDRVDVDELHSRFFVLDGEQDIVVHGTALATRWEEPISEIWILDASTRKVVWDIDDAELGRSRRGVADFQDKVSLPAGQYELYLSTARSSFGDRGRGIGFGEIIRRLVREVDNDDYDDDVVRVQVTVEGKGLAGGQNTPERVRGLIAADAIVAFTAMGDDVFERQGFALTAPTRIHVRALGEAERDAAYDAAWISDADTGERLFELDYWHSDRAGGARKNRVADEVIELAAGRYLVGYASDGSHSYPEFNSSPPRDPMAWGIVVRLEDPTQRARVSTFAPEESLGENILVSLTRVRNDEHRSEGFTLTSPTRVRIVALGESSGREMADYGWIVDARDHSTLWEMEYRRTEPAGGSSKNRIADEVIDLEPGSYMVHYVSDGSHAFRDWNAAPPFERDRWGITVLAVGQGFDPTHVAPYRPVEQPGVLVRIDRVGDDSHRRAHFVLDRASDLSVYALGEGRRGRMFDYAWIEENDSGRTVWEMTYRMTENAGGASKNRAFNGTLHLPAGSYTMHYETDGSHAYGDWNTAPPHDPEGWGIVIRKVDTLPAEAQPLPLEAPPQ